MRAFSMISRRLAALTLSLLAFAGCHEDPTVEAILVQPSTAALGLFSAGGAASSVAGVDGVGGTGGDFKVTTNGLISLGSPSFVPSAPAVPAAPSTFEYVAVAGQATVTKVGSIEIPGSITSATTTPVVITSSNGDIVVDGALQSGDTGTAQVDLQLIAPNGTVFVTGSIRTAGLDSASNGRAGGNLTIPAARVVITGTIDTHGVANTTVVAANGGKGGDVDVTSSQGPIYLTAGSIVTTGGLAVDTAGTASMKGGAGGFVHLNSAAPANSIYIFAPVTTDGGAMTGNGLTPTGGAAGNVAMRGSGEVDIVASVSMLGGAATGNSTDAVGGAGGNLSVDGPAICKLYGSVLAGGGMAFAAVSLGAVTGGAGGDILLGQGARLNSVELGSGDFNQSGGTGGLSTGTGGGQGGAVAIESFDGDITIESSISVAGGAGSGVGNASGGAAGSILIRTDAAGTTLSNHVLTLASLAWLLNATGGAALGTGTGGQGGTVLMQSGGDLTCGARIAASGGASVSGTGGSAAPGAVLLQVLATAITATGDLSVAGTIDANGGLVSSGGTGGDGSNVTIQILAGNGTLSSSATITATGSNGGVAAGGNPGNLLLLSQGGDLNLSGTLTVSGSSSPVTPKASGNITVRSGGALQSSAAMNALGGAGTDVAGLVAGTKGGAILFDGTSSLASVTLVGGSSILADGGTAIGSLVGTLGGAGGSVTLQTRGRAIDMSGSLLARGGAVSGIGTGGIGGKVIAVSDFLAGGTAGNITLESGSAIDVSGGSGTVLGVALQVGVDPGTVLVLPIALAVLFDANNGTGGAGGTTVGRITNLGSITATGSSGGDIYYNGLNSLGAALAPADGIGLNFTGTISGHFYPH
jgi:hypothetical protein